VEEDKRFRLQVFWLTVKKLVAMHVLLGDADPVDLGWISDEMLFSAMWEVPHGDKVHWQCSEQGNQGSML
jgi:hypothetical protein